MTALGKSPQKSQKSKRKRLDIGLYLLIFLLGVVLLFLLNPALWRYYTGTPQLVDIPPSAAKTALIKLTVRDANEPTPKYRRAEFGKAWEDVDSNGCSTRNDVLRRDLTQLKFHKTQNCVVENGILNDPYTGQKIKFKRGRNTSDRVQIDHVVALGDAWRAGAHKWSTLKRLKFANDPENLLAVAGVANEAKGRMRADEWLPPSEKYHCAYVARQIRVKAKWGLSVTETERDAMIRVLAGCPAVD